jgi:hypothetical protein
MVRATSQAVGAPSSTAISAAPIAYAAVTPHSSSPPSSATRA